MALNPPVSRWLGQRVWLVGASSGIGRATAAALHAQGAQVLVWVLGTAALLTVPYLLLLARYRTVSVS